MAVTWPISVVTRASNGAPLNSVQFDTNLTTLQDASNELNDRVSDIEDGTTTVPNADTVDTFHASQTPTANTIPVSDATGTLNKGWIEEIFKKQGFINLIKNGNFASWSVGDISAPDGWNFGAATAQRITTATDNSLGHDFIRLTSDASGNTSSIVQDSSSQLLLSVVANTVIAQNLTVTAVAKVRTTNNNVYIGIVDGIGTVSKIYSSGSGDWEYLVVQRTYNGTESYLGVRIGIEGANNTTNITFDVGEIALYIGNLALPYQENPLDRALEAIHYTYPQAGTVAEYRNLRAEVGACYVVGDGLSEYLTTTVTFQKPFRKILECFPVIKSTTSTGTSKLVTEVTELTTSSVTIAIGMKDAGNVLASGIQHYAYWLAIGVD